MKVLDSSSMIAYFGELAEPNLLLCWLDYQHRLFIPAQVHSEIQKNQATFNSCKKHLGKEMRFIKKEGVVLIAIVFPSIEIAKFRLARRI